VADFTLVCTAFIKIIFPLFQLPYSEDAEKGVPCSLLLSPREVADLSILRLQPDAFYAPAHKIIYELVIEFSDKSKPIDFITLKQSLNDRGFLEKIGGPEFLNDLYTFIPTGANAGYYIDIVRENYLLRRLILSCNSLASRCYDGSRECRAIAG
jgi:replicative DNA helicase